MKPTFFLLCLLMAACQHKQERFQREASAFPKGYVGRWEVVLHKPGSQVFQAGVTIETSGDSLLWQYFSQVVDTTTNRKIPCGAEMDFMPVWWDDSLHLVQANHGVGQGYGYDFLRLKASDQLQMNSPSLASDCRTFFSNSQLTLSKVDSFRYQP